MRMAPLKTLSILLSFLALISSAMAYYAPNNNSSLKVGFYRSTCPSAEYIVRSVVLRAMAKDPGVLADFVRMHFHDCFVRGCDASILLKSTPGNVAERDHPANNPSLDGFDEIDEAKAKLEAVCPNQVSCADIIAYAARDSVHLSGGLYYDVLAGRRDGRISRASEVVGNLPPPNFNAQQLIANFAKKGMSVDEMVTLSGAHSIGVAHCSSFAPRLYAFNKTHPQDPSLDPAYAARLKAKCPPPSNLSKVDPVVPFDPVTPTRLDTLYYKELIYHQGLLTSDETLYLSPQTSGMVLNNAKYSNVWAQKFAKAMVHLGSVEVLTGTYGEIRKTCGKIN